MLRVSCNGRYCHWMPDLSDGLVGDLWSKGLMPDHRGLTTVGLHVGLPNSAKSF